MMQIKLDFHVMFREPGHRLKAGQFSLLSFREKRGISCLAYEIPRFSRNDRREIIRFVPL